jgi:hypothetical protein
MDDNPAPPKLGKHGGKRIKGEQACNTRLVYGTVTYWLDRLEREGRHDLIAGIKSRQISAHAAAVQLGWVKRRKTGVIDGDHNLTRRREGAMASVLAFSSPIPCFACSHMNATAALREIADTYAQVRKGEPVRRSLTGVLPSSCCRRQIRPVAEALIA